MASTMSNDDAEGAAVSRTTDSVAKQVESFFSAYPLKKFAKGELVIFADNTVPPVSYLVSGTVAQYDISEGGHKLILTIYKPGAFFPMAYAINNMPNNFFFEAMEDVQVRSCPAEACAQFVRSHPDVLYDLLRRVYKGMEGLLGRLSQLMAGTARGLLLFELSVMAERFGKPHANGTLVSVTANQLASQTGLARETVSRELHKCSQEGLLQIVKGGLVIPK